MPIELGKKKKSGIQVSGQPNKPVEMGCPKGSAVWGKIMGDINNQRDLAAALQEAKDWAVVGWVL